MKLGKDGVQIVSSNRLDLKLPSRIDICLVFFFIVAGIIFTSPFAINDAFAINVIKINDGYDNNFPVELKWQMVFISSSSACSNYHYQMMQTYYDIAIQYMKLYELENISYEPLCMTEKKYLSSYDNPSDVDLLILVYDNDLGEKELHSNQMGGVYTHSGIDKTQNHVIIICDCSNFDYSSPVWILSHELSHFILYYNGFEMSVIERLIHVNDLKYDECLEESTSCKSTSVKMVAGPGGYAYSVMPIYQPAVNLQSKNELSNDETKFPVNSELSKILTQWWASNIISDAQYSDAIGYFVDSDVLFTKDGSELILADEPFDDVVTWEQMMEEITPTYWDREPKNEIDTMPYLSKIPSNMKPDDKNLNFGLPDWFKETALLWGDDLITNEEFKKNIDYLVNQGIIESHSSSIFQELVTESETIVQTPSIQNSKNVKQFNEPPHQDLVSEESLEIVTQSVNEEEKNIQVVIDQNNEEKLSPDPTSEDSSKVKPENVTEYHENITDVQEDIHKLFEFIYLFEIDNRVIQSLEAAATSYDDGDIKKACSDLENFFIILEELIDSNNIEQTFGQTLIAEGEIIKFDLCD